MEVMNDPVLLSSGIVLDRVSVFNDEGNMRFRVCPLTKKQLDSKVYPVQCLKAKAIEYNKHKFANALLIANKFKADK